MSDLAFILLAIAVGAFFAVLPMLAELSARRE